MVRALAPGSEPAEMVGSTTRFRRNNAGQHLADQRNQPVPPDSAA